MAYSGLETLFQNMGPAFAGTAAGEREGIAQSLDALLAQKQAEDIRAAQQTYGQKELTNPLEVSRMGLENTGLGLKNTKDQQSIDLTTATQPGAINATNAENDIKVYGAKLKKLTDIRNIVTEGTANLGTGLNGELNKQKFLESGVVPPGAMYDRIRDTPVEQLPKIMEDINKAIARTSSAYIQAMDVAAEHSKSANYTADQHLKGVQGTNAAMLKGKQMEIDAGKYDKAKASKSFYESLQLASPDKRIGAVKVILDTGIDPATKEPLTPMERAGYQALYDQDARTLNAKNAAGTGGGAGAVVDAKGNIVIDNKIPKPGVSDTKKVLSDEDLLKKYGGK